ncbi:MAG TPA: sugar ABC transporter permease [Actinomycetota bacterium]|nr:sugar ABC transporter permease [Actinomycetota bacterium]
MSPWLIGFFVFTLYPILASFYYSLTHFDLLSHPIFNGLANYRFMFTKDPFFWQAIRNTLWIIIFGVPLRIAFAVGTAWLLVKPRRGIRVYRTIFFLPTLAPAVAAALAFVFIFNPAFGPVNQILSHLGVKNTPLWFQSPTWSKPGLLILGLWGVGDAMIIFLAGMLNVPRQLYEAADIEGASGWQKFRHVTLPLISPVIFFSLVIGIIEGFQFFTEAYVTNITLNNGDVNGLGDPLGSLLFYTTRLYQAGWINFQMGYASALAWVLLVITMICTLAVMKSSGRWVFYQGGEFK